MLEKSITIQSSIQDDFIEIAHLGKSLDLDTEEMNWNQFIVAKKQSKIVGIGRLRKYENCTEIATVGVVPELQISGIGTLLIKELINAGPSELFVTCVIPEFFKKFGFQATKHYPPVLEKKVDFCKLYNFNANQIFVMKLIK